MMAEATDSNAFNQHDHAQCIDSALASARHLCAERGARLTPLREEVLQLVWQSHKPLGAYTLLEQLGARAVPKARRNAAPPTVYRALEFLREQGLVHRIDSLNAFIGCPHPGQPHQRFFLICRQCSAAVELISEPVATAIRDAATAVQFSQQSASLEVLGLCRACQRSTAHG